MHLDSRLKTEAVLAAVIPGTKADLCQTKYTIIWYDCLLQ